MLLNNIASVFVPRNWVGNLKLNFGLRDNRTVLLQCWHYGPFLVQKAFYYDDQVPHVYLLHPPGGLVAGDQLNLDISLEENSQVLLTTPGATKFYRSDGMYVFIKQKFYLAKGSVLEWLPQSNIFFPKSKVIIESELLVSEGAQFIFFDTLCFCCVQFQELYTSTLNMFISIVLENAIGLRERIKIHSAEKSILNKFAGCKVSAVLYALPGNIKILHDLRILINQHNIIAGGVTLLNNLLVVRLLDNKHESVQILLRKIWCFLRLNIIGKPAVIPRVWFT